MPYTKAQKRLFFAKANRGEMSMAEAKRLAGEPTKSSKGTKSKTKRRKA